MKTYARIQDGLVVELLETDNDIAKMFHPDLIWVECGAGTQQGWIYDGADFRRPVTVEPELQIPQAVTRRQGRLALIDAGKLTAVEAAIDAIEDPVEKLKTQVEYEADTWELGNAFLQALWAQLGGTQTQLESLFTLASTK